MNNEAKVRRSTRSIVLGKAKAMSFEDIEVVQAARATKEIIKGKEKRCRKRKSTTLEPDEPEPDELEVARAVKEVIKGNGKPGGKRKSTAQDADEPEHGLEPEVVLIIDAPVP